MVGGMEMVWNIAQIIMIDLEMTSSFTLGTFLKIESKDQRKIINIYGPPFPYLKGAFINSLKALGEMI